jgi:hypothetical protein
MGAATVLTPRHGAGGRAGADAPESGRHRSLGKPAAAAKVDRGYIARTLQPTVLTPYIIDAILDGRAPHGLGLAQLMQPVPARWNAQQARFARTYPTASERLTA